MTPTPAYAHDTPQGGGEICMAGVIWTYQRCPACGGKFPTSKGGFPIICATCKTQPTKFIIKVYWQGKGHDIARDREGRTVHHWNHAVNLLGNIRSEIQARTFDPELYKKQAKTRFKRFWGRFQNKYKGSPSTWAKLDAIGRHHLTYFDAYHLRDIRAFHVDEWWEEMKDKGLSPHYMNDIHQWLKRFLTEARDLDIIDKVPHFPKTLKEPIHEIKWFTKAEQDQVLNHLPKHDRPIFEFLFLTGVRVGEAIALQRSDIDMTHKKITVQRTIRRDGTLGPTKARKTRMVIISADVKKCLTTGLTGLKGFVFTNKWGRHYSDDYLRDTFNRACQKAQIKPIPLKNATRHSFGMRLLSQGYDIWTVKEYMGHADIKMTERYVQAILEDGERVYSRG